MRGRELGSPGRGAEELGPGCRVAKTPRSMKAAGALRGDLR